MTLFAPTDNPTNQVFHNEQKSSLRDRRNETTTGNTVVMRANRLKFHVVPRYKREEPGNVSFLLVTDGRAV